MKKLLLGTIVSFALLGFSAGAWADSISEVWMCTLKDGKTLADAQAVNKQWIAWMRANVSDKITSSAATPVVADLEGFMYVDTYPDLATWAAGKAKLETDEGQAVDNGFNDVMKCSSNRLWKLHPTE